MKVIRWNEKKNQLLKIQKGISFDEIVEKIEKREILGRKKHPNELKYPNQYIFLFGIEGYVYYVPYIENDNEIFLKTIIPSRKYTKEYRRNNG